MKRSMIGLTILTASLLNIGACMIATQFPLIENTQALAYSSTDTSLDPISCEDMDSIPDDQGPMADQIY
ncbi:MAG: hypothetical protein KAR32_06790 [Candidatus Omnitrophica bacterium]|nr:hypothetical protein [Candidatus Omnitrophota bacterium]